MEIKQKGIVLCKNRCILISVEGVKQKHLLRIPQIYKNSYFSAKANLNLPSFFERIKMIIILYKYRFYTIITV